MIKEITVDAKIENIPAVTEFVDAFLESIDCPGKIQVKFAVAIDELLANIDLYGYTDDSGEVTVRVETDEEHTFVTMVLIDSAIPYNPLAKEDPDVTLSAEEREIGGLGIYLVKNFMDEMSYEYKDGHNILSMKKYLTASN